MPLSIEDLKFYPQTSAADLGTRPVFQALGGDAPMVYIGDGVFTRDTTALYPGNLKLVLKGDANKMGARAAELTVRDKVIQLGLNESGVRVSPFGPLGEGFQLHVTNGPNRGLLVNYMQHHAGFDHGLNGAQVRFGGQLGDDALALSSGSSLTNAEKIKLKIASVGTAGDLHPTWLPFVDRPLPDDENTLRRLWNSLFGRLTHSVRTGPVPNGFENWLSVQLNPSERSLIRPKRGSASLGSLLALVGVCVAVYGMYEIYQHSDNIADFGSQLISSAKASFNEMTWADMAFMFV